MSTITNPLRIVRPTWADGPLQLALCDVRTSTLTLGVGSIARILDNNPARWGFVLQPDTLPVANLRLSPFPDADLFGWTIDFAIPPNPITIMDWGPLVPREWYLYSGSATTVRVVEWFARH